MTLRFPGAPAVEKLYDAYRLQEPLGGGSDGQVLRGIVRRGPDQGGSHAVKRFRSQAYDPSRELELLAWIQPRQNILQLLGVFEDGTTKAFSTPLMDMDLATFRMRRPRGLAATQALSFCQQLWRGLQHMQSLRVVHRDVNVQLADFSRSRELPKKKPVPQWQPGRQQYEDEVRVKEELVEEDAHADRRVQMIAGLCTPEYEAPECAWGTDICRAGTSQDI